MLQHSVFLGRLLGRRGFQRFDLGAQGRDLGLQVELAALPLFVRAGAILPMYFVNLTPVFAGVLSYALLDEAIGLHHVLGGALIIAGIHLAGRQRSA